MGGGGLALAWGAMRTLVRCVFAAAAAVLLPLGAAANGCTPTSSPSTPTPDAEAVCPDTLAATLDARCEVEGLVCSPQYPCGVLAGIAHCVCTAGAFACTDLEDAAIEGPDATPACPAAPDAEACPAIESKAAMQPCTEVGLSCAYSAACDAIPAFDQCVCTADPSGQTGPRFVCSDPCAYVGPPVDAGDSDDESADSPGAADQTPGTRVGEGSD